MLQPRSPTHLMRSIGVRAANEADGWAPRVNAPGLYKRAIGHPFKAVGQRGQRTDRAWNVSCD